MISFKQFLEEDRDNEDESSVYKAKEMFVPAMLEWIEKNSSQYLKNLSKMPPLLRGMQEEQHGIIDTNKFNRRSANTRNYYTLFLDNTSIWAKYPKRSKSLICTNSYRVAEGFGDVHYIFPKDSNLIGICPEDDFWGSFNIEEKIGVTWHSLDPSDIMTVTDRLASLVDADVSESNWPRLEAALKDIDSAAFEKMATEPSKAGMWYAKVCKAFIKKGYKNLYEVYVDIFNPVENKFAVETAGEITLSPNNNNEMWIQGECVVIPAKYHNHLDVADSGLIEQFMTKYRIDKV